MLKIAVLGAGRMAHELVKVIQDSDECVVSSVWSRSRHEVAGIPVSDQLPQVLSDADVAIDFTLSSATAEVLRQSVLAGTALVCGVTGLDESQTQQVAAAALKLPLLYDRNMSYGIAVLKRLIRQLGPAFDLEFRAEIHETHHRNKIDAPSGTALMLGEALAESRGQGFEDVYHYDPNGSAATDPHAISFFVSREGDVSGEHSIVFRNANETLNVTHKVADRRVFAEGAVKAAQWLVKQPAGQYGMVDVLD